MLISTKAELMLCFHAHHRERQKSAKKERGRRRRRVEREAARRRNSRQEGYAAASTAIPIPRGSRKPYPSTSCLPSLSLSLPPPPVPLSKPQSPSYGSSRGSTRSTVHTPRPPSQRGGTALLASRRCCLDGARIRRVGRRERGRGRGLLGCLFGGEDGVSREGWGEGEGRKWKSEPE